MQLPVFVVRRVLLSLRMQSHADEVIAAYPEQLVIVRLKAGTNLPAQVFDPLVGADELLRLRRIGRPIALPWSSIDWVESHRVWVPRPSTTIKLRSLGVRKKLVLEPHEADTLLEAFANKIPGRLSVTADSFDRSRSKIRLRTALATLVWMGVTFFLLWMLEEIVQGGKPPNNPRAFVVWWLLSFLLAKCGFWPTSLIVLAFGLIMLYGTCQVLMKQMGEDMGEPGSTP